MPIPERPLDVLHVSQPTEAGVARIVADLAAGQVRRGWRVGVACPSAGPLARWVTTAGGTHLEWAATRAPGPRVVAEIRRLRRCVESFRPDVIHLHSAKAGLAGRLLLRGRKPCAFEPNSWSFEAVEGPVAAAARAWERRGGRWCDVVVCVSEAERRVGEDAGIDARYRLVPNGIDLGVVTPASADDRAAARSRLALPDEPTVVCVGRLSPQKGQDLLLDAWPRILRHVPDARLYLVGDGPSRASLEERRVERVTFAGHRTDVPDWLAAADVVTMPSRWEGCSLAMLEALGRGRSVVAFDVSGAAEAIDGDAGEVLRPGDLDGLARSLTERLADPTRADDEGRAGRRRIEERHDLRVTETAVAEIYAEVLAARGL
ncbi:MAG TPA: glycosyltransferase family 4 protein [Actinomycetota bacterium]|jgi:glycosyltransferase involved in cell wall biosynthesis